MTPDVKALTFDVFGTLVDWRSGIAREARSALGAKGRDLDFFAFADAWRALYVPAMARVRRGERAFMRLDDLHRESLLEILAERAIADLSPSEIDHLTFAWRRLDPWPDVVAGLARLKRRYITATLSNANVALMVAMSRRAGLAWDAVLGAEVARAYKPDAAAYDTAATMLGLRPDECLMVAAHPSDLAAAAARGFRTAYVHRPWEFGPAGAGRPRPLAAFDLAVEGLTELADALGC